jgi:hypothetical protein
VAQVERAEHAERAERAPDTRPVLTLKLVMARESMVKLMIVEQRNLCPERFGS